MRRRTKVADEPSLTEALAARGYQHHRAEGGVGAHAHHITRDGQIVASSPT